MRWVTVLAGLALGAFAWEASALYQDKSTQWRGAPPLIPVCWENPTDENAAKREQIRRTIERTWQREARVNFIEWGECHDGDPGVHILLSNDFPTSALGTRNNGVTNGVNLHPGTSNLLPAAVHEFGHVLGFLHEEQRPEYVGTDQFPCRKQLPNPPIVSPMFYGSYDIDSVMSYCGGHSRDAIDLSPNDIASVRRAYGHRIGGSLVTPHGNCVAAWQHPGEPSFVWDCDEFLDNQEFDWDEGRLRHVGSGSQCLHASADGDPIVNAACSDPNVSKWRFQSVFVRGWGGLCLDLPGGNTANGANVLQMWKCGDLNGANQRWTITDSGKIRFGDTRKCVTALPSGGIFLYDCRYPTWQRFDFRSNGQISLKSYPNSCLDVVGWWDWEYANTERGEGLPWSGQQVQTFACYEQQTNQKWHVRGPIRHQQTGLCLTRSGGGDDNGVGVDLGPCNEQWDYYFR